jgi:hypothetical protein
MGILHIETLSQVSTDRKVVGPALLVNTRQRISGAESGIFHERRSLLLRPAIATQIARDLNAQYNHYPCM